MKHIMIPKADAAVSWSDDYGGCTHTAPASSNGYQVASVPPDTSNMFEYVDEYDSTLDESNSVALFSNRVVSGTPATAYGYVGFTMGDAPTNVTVLSVDLYGFFRASNATGGNGYWNSAATATVYGYVVSTSSTGTANTLSILTNTYTKRNSVGPTGTYAKKHLGTWTTNPVTALSWTQADLVNLVAGVRILSLPGVDEASTNEHVIEFAALWIEADVLPTDSPIEGPRKILSHQLRLKRKPLRKVFVQLPASYGEVEPGDTIWSAIHVDPTYDTATASQSVDRNDVTEQRPLFVTGVEIQPSPQSVTVEAVDLRDQYCTYWGTWRSDIGLTADYTGIAIMDQGGGYSMNRTAAGKDLVRRPSDFYFQEVAGSKPRFCIYGLGVFGGQFGASRGQSASSANTGEIVHALQYNTLSGGSGTTFTGWNTATSGTGAIAAITTPFVDIAGYRRGVRLTMGNPAASNQAFIYQDSPSLTNAYNLRVYLRFSALSDAVAKKVCYLLRNNTTLVDWNPSTGTFSGNQWVEVGGGLTYTGSLYRYQSGSGPAHYEYWSTNIPVPSTTTYRLHAGYIAYASAFADIHAAGLIHNGTLTQPPIRREFSATVGSTVTPYADEYSLYNGAVNRIWYGERGFCSFRFTPAWDHSDLPDGRYKRLVTAWHSGTTTANGDREEVYYYRHNSTTAYIDFFRYTSGSLVAAARYTATGSTLAQYMVPINIAVRWTDVSELGLAPQTLDVFVNGVKGAPSSSGGGACVLASAGDTTVLAPYIYIGHHPVSGAGLKEPAAWADGYFSDFEVRNWCPTDREVYLLHKSYTTPGLPALVS